MTIHSYVNYFKCKRFSYESHPSKNYRLKDSKLRVFVYVNDVADLQCLLKAKFVKDAALYLKGCKQFQTFRTEFLSTKKIVVKMILNKTIVFFS